MGGNPVLAREAIPVLEGGTLVLERTWDQRHGKEPGTGVCSQKGPGTRDLKKNLGLGYPRVWTDKQTENITLHPSFGCERQIFNNRQEKFFSGMEMGTWVNSIAIPLILFTINVRELAFHIS